MEKIQIYSRCAVCDEPLRTRVQREGARVMQVPTSLGSQFAWVGPCCNTRPPEPPVVSARTVLGRD